jgi:hypothetical protein
LFPFEGRVSLGSSPATDEREFDMGPILTILVVVLVVAAIVYFLRRA